MTTSRISSNSALSSCAVDLGQLSVTAAGFLELLRRIGSTERIPFQDAVFIKMMSTFSVDGLVDSKLVAKLWSLSTNRAQDKCRRFVELGILEEVKGKEKEGLFKFSKDGNQIVEDLVTLQGRQLLMALAELPPDTLQTASDAFRKISMALESASRTLLGVVGGEN